MNSNYNITTIEKSLQALVRSLEVSDKVYCNRPRAVADSVNDFVVVKVSGSVDDLSAYAKCTISISLFAKDLANIKNTEKLSYMQEHLTAGMPASEGKLLITTKPRILGDTPDDFGFHARVIVFNNVIIKSV